LNNLLSLLNVEFSRLQIKLITTITGHKYQKLFEVKIMAYYEHLKDNKWRHCTNDPNAVGRKRLYQQVEVPPDIYRSERKTKQWLDRQLALYVDKVENGEIVKSARLTLDDFLPQWQNGYAKQNMGDYTRYMTDNMYRIYIQPVFGHMRIDKITTLQLVNFFARDRKSTRLNSSHVKISYAVF